MYLGIDCGTQGTKAVLFEPENGQVIGRGYAHHALISGPDGRREQNADWWIEALKVSVSQALQASGRKAYEVVAIAVSGQHHGLVMLGADGEVLRNVKLWNDTETAAENERLIAGLGGIESVWRLISTSLPTGYTASKLCWVKRHEPAVFSKLRHVLLPHDYLNYWLTGEIVTEAGEASGTGFFDVASRNWSDEMVTAIDPSGLLAAALPRLVSAKSPIGVIRKEVAEAFGFSPSTLVACGSGDNVMGAVGTANVAPGRATLGLGTSGVINLYSETQPQDVDRHIQVFCGVDGGWIPTTNTMNATSSTSMMQGLFEIRTDAIDGLIGGAGPGAGGVRIFPYFDGERMPALPNAGAVMKGLTSENFTRANLMRATAEAVAFGLKWGYDRTTRSFGKPSQFRLTGGGANSAAWRQIVADVFETPVVRVKSDEGGALGAALLALTVAQRDKGHAISLREVCDRFVELDERMAAQPRPDFSAQYREIYAGYSQVRETEVFDRT